MSAFKKTNEPDVGLSSIAIFGIGEKNAKLAKPPRSSIVVSGDDALAWL